MKNHTALRRNIVTTVPCLLAMVVVTACASSRITGRDELVTGKVPRPNQIFVYDFAATADEIPDESALAGQPFEHPTPQTDAEIAEGRKLGAEIAAELAEQIRNMGMPAEEVTTGAKPQINDLVIRGYLLSIYEGSMVKRVGIGFGAGASELKTAVEGFQMTAHGLRKLGSGSVDAGGNKTPGAALGVAALIATANPAGLIISTGMKVYGEASGSAEVEGRAKQTGKEIADVIKKRFQEQGWIE